MNNKSFFFLILIFTLILLSTQFVSANDLNQTLGVSDNSFSEFQRIVDNSNNEINITKDYTYHEGDKPIFINKSIVINGNNHTFNALNKSSIFNIEAHSVVIKNLNFINANAGEFNLTTRFVETYKSFIFNDNGQFSVNYNYLFSYPDSNFGGAISSKANNLLIRDSTFENNYASFGGAIYCDVGNLSIDNVNFINNHAYYGGSIFLNDTNSTVFNSNFIRNNAYSYGAGIYQKKNNIKIINTTFMKNQAVNNATLFLSGFWDFLGINLTYYNSFINFNKIFNPFCGVENIYNNTYELMIKFPWYDSFMARDDVVNKSFCLKINNKELYNLTVNSNRCASLKFNSTLKNCDLLFFNPITHSNYTISTILCNNSFYNLQKLIDSNSEVNLTSDYRFCEGNSEITITKPVIINGNGHVIDAFHKARIFNIVSDNVVIRNVTFTNANYSKLYDDFGDSLVYVIYIVGYLGLDAVCYDSGTFFDQSNQDVFSKEGGAIYCSGNNLKVFNSKFINNYAKFGGAIYNSGLNSLFINLSFINNTSEVANSIFNNGDSYISNAYFNSNNRNYIYSEGNINIQNSTFINRHIITFKGTWQIDNMTSGYYHSFIKFNHINFNYNLTHLYGDYYNLKLNFGLSPFWMREGSIGYDYYGFSKNKIFYLEVNDEVYKLSTNSDGEANIKLMLPEGLYYIKVFNPITKMNKTKIIKYYPMFHKIIKRQLNSTVISKNLNYNIKWNPINAKKYTFYKKSLKIKISVKKHYKNNFLKVKFKGNTYKININKNGVSYFKIPKKVFKTLKKGKKYSYTISYLNCNLVRYIVR